MELISPTANIDAEKVKAATFIISILSFQLANCFKVLEKFILTSTNWQEDSILKLVFTSIIVKQREHRQTPNQQWRLQ